MVFILFELTLLIPNPIVGFEVMRMFRKSQSPSRVEAVDGGADVTFEPLVAILAATDSGVQSRAPVICAITLAALDAIAAVGSAARATAGKVGTPLHGPETYVTGQAALIIDYAAARHDAEPISTAPTESAVQWLLHRRTGAPQQMRWSPRGAP
jgi:hypothetical protein